MELVGEGSSRIKKYIRVPWLMMIKKKEKASFFALACGWFPRSGRASGDVERVLKTWNQLAKAAVRVESTDGSHGRR